MTLYKTSNVKFSNLKFNELKSAVENSTQVTLKLPSNVVAHSDDEIINN